MKVRIHIPVDCGRSSRWIEFETTRVVVEQDDAGIAVTYDDEYTNGFAIVPFTAPNNLRWQGGHSLKDPSPTPIKYISYQESLSLSEKAE